MENKFTPADSIQVISNMIAVSKGKIKSSAFFFILWGWTVITGNTGQFILTHYTNYEHPYYFWFIGIISLIVTIWRLNKIEKTKKVKTYPGVIIMNTWIVFGICTGISIFFGSSLNNQVIPLIMLFTGMATYITGVTINYNPFKWGGMVFFPGVITCFFVESEYHPIIMSLSIALGYLVPGYLLKYKD